MGPRRTPQSARLTIASGETVDRRPTKGNGAVDGDELRELHSKGGFTRTYRQSGSGFASSFLYFPCHNVIRTNQWTITGFYHEMYRLGLVLQSTPGSGPSSLPRVVLPCLATRLSGITPERHRGLQLRPVRRRRGSHRLIKHKVKGWCYRTYWLPWNFSVWF